MAPKSKKAAPVASASILDFFPRRSQTSSSQPVPQPSTVQKVPPRPDQEVTSSSHISLSSGTRSVITLSDTSSDPLESISSRVTRQYRPKSPPSRPSTTKHSTVPKETFKRKAKLDSDSEIDSIDAVAYLPRSPARTRTSAGPLSKPQPMSISHKENLTHKLPQVTPIPKKPRISPPPPCMPSPGPKPPVDPSDPELIPSSQSDEDELAPRLLARDSDAIMEEVDRRRSEAHSPDSLAMSEPREDMDVDTSPPEAMIVVHEEAPSSVFTPEPSPEPQQQSIQLTPQQPRLVPSLPVTPVALTAISKTAQIIADIKARAYAEALSSPEDSPLLELRDLEDSSDDEDLLGGITLKNDPFTSSPLSPLPTNRYSLRVRGAPGADSTSRPSAPLPVPAESKKAHPFAALLREKRDADKDGTGGLAFSRAEAAIRSESPLSEPEDWADEAAALAAVKAFGTSTSGLSDSEEVSLNNEDQCRLLGEERGKAVVNILDSDRARRESAKGKQKVLGVPLWNDDATSMDTDAVIPSFPDHIRGHPALTLLKSSIYDNEVCDFVMALLLVGMDSSSPPDLQREIMVAVDLLCRSLARYTDVSAGIEAILCNKLIKSVSDLDPSNKSHCIALLAGGSGCTARIARWVAHAVVTMSTTVSEATYNDLPPLLPILEALSPALPKREVETRIRGVLELHENTDYVDLGFYIQILAVALSNVESYVQEQAPVAIPQASPGKASAEKPDTMLTLVRHAIESVHGSIVDTRAAHLDRSRAKAALKQLSMRLHYQQEAALKSLRGRQSRPIQQYFSKSK
ncbi:hypothetical protein GGX14DRAFT_598937 [Mycena pura]|uniref:Uncharacterized protein n=1 Tax=Mycena pura TaxID=153505 RepID=A0AAD6VN70_9AGAR|nr:hypothetical protein GGX14DRAFT_598937 [Mycena pura]